MSSDALAVELTVAKDVLDRIDPRSRSQLIEAVTTATAGTAAALGVRTVPRVAVVAGNPDDGVDPGPFALTVAQRRCPVRVGTLGTALQTVASVTSDRETAQGLMAQLTAGPDGQFAELAGRWCQGVLDAAPAVLLTDAEALERAEEFGLPVEEASILRLLLAHRVSLTRAAATPYTSDDSGGSLQAWTDTLLAQSTEELSVRFHPELLRRLTLDGDPSERSALSDARQEVFDALGLLLPPLRMVADSALPEECFAFGVGDLITPPDRAVPAGWTMVLPDDGVDPEEATARTWIDPATRCRAGISPSAGHGISGLGYIGRALGATVRDSAPCFVTARSVEQVLDLTAAIYPILVASVRSRYGSVRLAGLFRESARDGLSLRHLPPILERLDEIALELTEPQSDLGTSVRGAAAWVTSDPLRRGDVVLLTLSEDDERMLIEASRAWSPWLPPDDGASISLRHAYRDRWQESVTRAPALLARQEPGLVGRALRAAFPLAPVLGPVEVVPADLALRAQPLPLTRA